MKSNKEGIIGEKKYIFISYYTAMALAIINMSFIFVGHKRGMDMFIPLIVEMMLTIMIILMWGKLNKFIIKDSMLKSKTLYICIALLIIHILYNIVLYKTGMVVPFVLDIISIIIEFILFIAVLFFASLYKEELIKCELSKEQTSIDKFYKLTVCTTIMIWYIFIIVN